MELTENPTASYLILQSLCNQVRLRQPNYGIINIATRLFLAMSRPVTHFSSMTIKYRRCWTGSKQGVTRGYKDGLQPESLADGNWLVKQNQPVSKIETKSDTNLRSLYES